MRFAYITLVLLVSLFAVAKNVNGEQNGNSAVQQKTLLQSFWDWLSRQTEIRNYGTGNQHP
uniref:Uncharacterized protein n=1 Tax=Trichobilharzia regenti TaxID=157069 RepID=A0AA85IVM4_TRIRE|nr:unnamed protein product [Trichobilharzia regenti]